MEIRKYQRGDENTLWELFFTCIHKVNSADYSNEQVSAWAPPDMDLQIWKDKIASINPYVAVINSNIVGYADIQETGLIDHFFCHAEYQRQGVGKALMSMLIQDAMRFSLGQIYSNVSITARPFFERMGFSVDFEQKVEVRGQRLTNVRMVKFMQSS